MNIRGAIVVPQFAGRLEGRRRRPRWLALLPERKPGLEIQHRLQRSRPHVHRRARKSSARATGSPPTATARSGPSTTGRKSSSRTSSSPTTRRRSRAERERFTGVALAVRPLSAVRRIQRWRPHRRRSERPQRPLREPRQQNRSLQRRKRRRSRARRPPRLRNRGNVAGPGIAVTKSHLVFTSAPERRNLPIRPRPDPARRSHPPGRCRPHRPSHRPNSTATSISTVAHRSPTANCRSAPRPPTAAPRCPARRAPSGPTARSKRNRPGSTTGTPYHYRFKATNEKGTNFGIDRTFVPAYVLKVKTLPPSPVAEHEVTLRGSLDPDGKADRILLRIRGRHELRPENRKTERRLGLGRDRPEPRRSRASVRQGIPLPDRRHQRERQRPSAKIRSSAPPRRRTSPGSRPPT